MNECLTASPVLTIITLSILTVLATLRLTRLVTTDSLGRWLIVDPLNRWAQDRELAHRTAWHEVLGTMDPEGLDDKAILWAVRKQAQLDDDTEWMTWQGRLISGLICPFCVGFWIGAFVTVATIFLAPIAWVGTAWVILLAALSLNYVAGHVSARLD